MQRRRLKWIVGVVAVLVIADGGYYAWKKFFGGAAGPQGGGMPVVTYTVVPQAMMEDINAVGTLQADESADLKTEVAGQVMAVHFTEGQPVKQGEALLEIDDRTLRQELERTHAAYELARITYTRRAELKRTGSMSAQAQDEAQAQLRASSAAYEDAKIRFDKAHIVAPFDGIIGLRSVSIGDYLQVGASISHIVKVKPMKVEFTVPEKYFSTLQPGQSVSVTMDAWPGKEFEGQLYAVDPRIDPDTRNVLAKAVLPNDEALLRPGMLGYLRLRVSTNANALSVPEEALIPNGQQLNVMKVVDGKVVTVPVKVGVRNKAMAQVTEGLASGDVIITAGQMKVRDGMPVQSVPGPQSKNEAPKAPATQGMPPVVAAPGGEAKPEAPVNEAAAPTPPPLVPPLPPVEAPKSDAAPAPEKKLEGEPKATPESVLEDDLKSKVESGAGSKE